MYLEQTQVVGELLEAIQALRMEVQSLARSVGQSMPDAGGRLRVVTDTTSSLGTITAMTSLSNAINIGGYSGTEHIPSLSHMSADNLRRNITVS